MRNVLARLSLGIGLIVVVSAGLLLSDLKNRSASKGNAPRVAIFQLGSQAILDEIAEGAIQGLAAKGFENGQTMRLQRYNAQSDLATAANIAKAIVDEGPDLVLTISTTCLQAMAAANQNGKIKHIFGGVSDPSAAGVGIQKGKPLAHPPHMAGIGTFQPVAETIELARKMNPGLRTAGLVYNPAETNSELCARAARAKATELGMRVVEATVETANEVFAATASVVSRGAEAIFIGGDNTLELAIESVVKAASEGGIPVFGYMPTNADRGALAGLGANYFEVGRITGELAGDVLNGRDPRTVPIENVLPKTLHLNLGALAKLRNQWRVPEDIQSSADVLIDRDGRRIERRAQARSAAPSRKWKIDIIELVEAPAIEESRKGVLAGLKESGLAEGRDYEIRVRNAQGDISTLTSLIDAAITAGSDMIYTITTPALQAAMNKVHDRPVLFTLSLDPSLVGDRGTHENHRANVAGVYDRSPFEAMMKLILECLPRARRIGTLFAPGEPNSVYFEKEMSKAAQAAGLELISLPSNNAAEVNDSAAALVQRGVDAICQINDNLHDAAFAAIATAARRARLPVFSFSTGQIGRGASVVLSNDHFDGGRESALIAAKVIRGGSPASFPYTGIRRTRLLVDQQAAAAVNFTIPAAVLARAGRK